MRRSRTDVPAARVRPERRRDPRDIDTAARRASSPRRRASSEDDLRDRLLRRTAPAGGSAIYIFAIDCSARARSAWRDPPPGGEGAPPLPPRIRFRREPRSALDRADEGEGVARRKGGAQRLVSSARPTHHPTEDPIIPPRSSTSSARSSSSAGSLDHHLQLDHQLDHLGGEVLSRDAT